MNAVIDKLPALVDEELAAANAEHEQFHSLHEGWAVLKEEIEEAHAELINVECYLGQLWEQVKRDDAEAAKGYVNAIEWRAICLAAEAIQVAAMARKMQDSIKAGDS